MGVGAREALDLPRRTRRVIETLGLSLVPSLENPSALIALLVGIAGEILSVVFVVRVLSRGGSASVTLAWVLIILAAPYVGLVLYYLLPRRIHMRRLKHRVHRRAFDSGSPRAIASTESEPDDPVLRLLERLAPDSVTRHNRVELLASGARFAEQACAAIDAATEFVHVQTFILRPDDTGLRFLERLRDAAARGVEVRLLYDSMGSWSLRGRHLRELRRAGGRAAAFLPLLWRRRPFTLNLRNHRKLIVVDSRVAFVGGRNVADEYFTDRLSAKTRWDDVMVRIDGPAAARLHRVFVRDWLNAADEDVSRDEVDAAANADDDRVGVLATGPDVADVENRLLWALMQIIVGAARSIDISSPYLVPAPPVVSALCLAATRGVRVRLHTNGRGVEGFVMHRAQRSNYATLLAAGIEILENNVAYTHAKMVLVDERQLLIGSPNLDWRSSELNFELAVVVTDADVCRDARELFERRIEGSDPVTLSSVPSGWFNRSLDGLCRILSPLL